MLKKRVIIKIGTNVLTNNNQQLDLNNMKRIVDQISHEYSINNNVDFIIVSSGAITSGAKHINISPENLAEKQAAAAVGQILLFQKYYSLFQKNNICVGQLLVTKDNFNHIEKKQNIIQTINTLLNHNTIPIINENDSVSTEEIQFGDNDQLSAILATNIHASHLIFLTNIDGVLNKENIVIPILNKITKHEINLTTNKFSSPYSKGGMSSKLLAAKIALDHNIEVTIANGKHKGTIHKILAKEPVGTKIKRIN